MLNIQLPLWPPGVLHGFPCIITCIAVEATDDFAGAFVEWKSFSVGEHYFQTGEIDLSRFHCHQLNGSFCALTAMRTTVQWYCQGCFNEDAIFERLVFGVRRRGTEEATRHWIGANTGNGTGSSKKMKLDNYFNRQLTDHISTQNGVLESRRMTTGMRQGAGCGMSRVKPRR